MMFHILLKLKGVVIIMNTKITLKNIMVVLIMTALCFSATACSKSQSKDIRSATMSVSSTSEVNADAINKSNPITIKYVGNSCFYITFSDGTRLVTDPYGTSYAVTFGDFPSMTADVVTVCANDADHKSGISDVLGKPKIILPEDLNKTIKVGKVEITGYASPHVVNGDNTIFVYKYDGLKIVHMGEADSIASQEAQDAVRDADVILAYAGELGNTKNVANFESLNKLNIKVIIPQHFSKDSDDIWFGEPTIDKILTELPQGTNLTKATTLIVNKDLVKQFLVLSSK
jgi:L-ascorbate metabolism protein UlaG (beta-lactamase superfamily)